MKHFILSLNLKGVKRSTWIRMILYMISLCTMILKYVGVNLPIISESDVSEIISLVFIILVFLQGYWKNNSFTKVAQEVDEILNERK